MSSYVQYPSVRVPAAHASSRWVGWEEILEHLRTAAIGARIVAVECYPGVHDDELRLRLAAALEPDLVIDTKEAFRSPSEIDALVAPYLGGDDPVFGSLSPQPIEVFLDPDRCPALRSRMAAAGKALIVGPAAAVLAPASDLLVYADMPRWEGQLRQRRGEVDNLGVRNRGLKASLQYKRSFFIDWRVADRLKRATMDRWDFLLDTTNAAEPRLITGAAHLATLEYCVTRPFRVVPFFDPGPWGGQWLKAVIGLDPTQKNFAWGFDCVPEENSLALEFDGGVTVEIPSVNLVFRQPRALLGESNFGRFGAEFPIRFDFLDTMGGGNLSFQVHPTTEYAREHFGLGYTQDESYYMLEAKPGCEVYLGRRNGADFEMMIAALEEAQRGGRPFDATKFAARFPAKKHDHFLIPAGTLHCSGVNGVVLEISATPYIFTFKLWDWGRLGLDGLPRPVNIARGREVIDWSRDEDYARARLINQITEITRSEGWREERTGLHEAEFIETRRHWFTQPVPHDTGGARQGGVHVLNLVQGDAVVVESPDGAFDPLEIHYAETFIVPAAVGAYTVRPLGLGEHATMKAFVRHRA